ncbi:MAG: class I SAM-dependent methyltransferase [Halodesulfurarchaeum sp.]
MRDGDTRDVRRVYDRIASHFSQTREFPWSEIRTFLEGKSGRVGVDLGCGNGRHLSLLASVVDTPVGVDVSRGILAEATTRRRERGFEADLLQGSVTHVPIRADLVDVGLYIATLHHLRSEAERIRSLDELSRILAPDGIGLVSVWSVDHDRFDRESAFDTEIDWTLPSGETIPRFYHIYDRMAFEDELETSGLEIVDSFVSSGNCFATVVPE